MEKKFEYIKMENEYEYIKIDMITPNDHPSVLKNIKFKTHYCPKRGLDLQNYNLVVKQDMGTSECKVFYEHKKSVLDILFMTNDYTPAGCLIFNIGAYYGNTIVKNHNISLNRLRLSYLMQACCTWGILELISYGYTKYNYPNMNTLPELKIKEVYD